MVQQNRQDEIKNSENTLQGSIDLCGAKTSAEIFKANRKDFNRQKQTQQEFQNLQASVKPLPGAESNVEQDGAEALKDFWSIQGDFIYRHHIEPRVQLYVPKEETFPIPLKYIDVTRSSFTNLDVLQEKRIDDNWNVNANQRLSDSWTGFTRFTLLKEKPPKGYS